MLPAAGDPLGSGGVLVISREELAEHPVTALDNMWQWGYIPQPVYVGAPLEPGSQFYAMVVEIQGYGFRVATGDTKTEAKRRAAEELLRHVLGLMCPTPAKMRYATEEVAYERVERHRNLRWTAIQSAYLCRCTWWHLTSRAR